MTSGQIREYVQQQGGYQEMALSDLQLIAEGNPATEEVQQAINTLAAKGVPLKPTTSTQVTPTFEQRKQRVIETAGQGFSRADEITQDNIHEFEDSFNIPRADSAPSSGTRRGVLGSDAKNELPNTNVEPFEPSKFRGEDDSGNEDNENEADS